MFITRKKNNAFAQLHICSNVNATLDSLFSKMFSLALKTFVFCEQNLSSSCGPRGPRLDNSSRGDRRLDRHSNLIFLANNINPITGD